MEMLSPVWIFKIATRYTSVSFEIFTLNLTLSQMFSTDTAAGGTHPTGMHSCSPVFSQEHQLRAYNIQLFLELFKKSITSYG